VARPAAETIVALQVDTGDHRGAIHQLWPKDAGEGGDGKFFPLYIARCIPPLLAVADATDDDRFERAAREAVDFLTRVEHDDGSFPQVIYANGTRNEYPRWIAGVGDVLRAYDALNARGYAYETAAVESWLRAGRTDSGAFKTAEGFGQVSGRGDAPVFADVLPVVGWNDKAFRWLATQVDTVEAVECGKTRVACSFDGTPGTFVDSMDTIEFIPERRASETYRWDKASRWAQLG
jgi:hypothetical protein